MSTYITAPSDILQDAAPKGVHSIFDPEETKKDVNPSDRSSNTNTTLNTPQPSPYPDSQRSISSGSKPTLKAVPRGKRSGKTPPSAAHSQPAPPAQHPPTHAFFPEDPSKSLRLVLDPAAHAHAATKAPDTLAPSNTKSELREESPCNSTSDPEGVTVPETPHDNTKRTTDQAVNHQQPILETPERSITNEMHLDASLHLSATSSVHDPIATRMRAHSSP